MQKPGIVFSHRKADAPLPISRATQASFYYVVVLFLATMGAASITIVVLS
jgi:hypothetical protein